MIFGEEFPEFVQTPLEAAASIQQRVHDLVEDGSQPEKLREFLVAQTEEDRIRILTTCTTDEQGQVCPPLVTAARNGHLNIVEVLLSSEFKSGEVLESSGKVLLGGYVIDGATPLWCAAGSGHFDIVKALVSAGANVNGMTKAKSTPLRAACFEGRLDIVSFLVSHGADVNIANKFNNTCLMISSYKGHKEVVRFLLDNGANPDTLACCGASALHFSSESGNLPIVKELVEYGLASTTVVNDNRMTPLMSAAERCQEEVFQYLITKTTDRRRRIEALELIGASFANDKDNYDLGKAYSYLESAMTLRWEDPNDLVQKVTGPPIEAYNYHVECQTLEDLVSIRASSDSLHMEGLAIRERVLGKDNPEVLHPIIYRGAVFADQAIFFRSIRLWMHALRLRQAAKTSVVKDLLRFAQVFSQMSFVRVVVPFEDIFEILSSASTEIGLCQERIGHPEPRDDPETHLEDLESNMTTFLYLTVILSKIIKDLPEVNVVDAMRCLHHVTAVLKPRTRKGRTLLHLAVDSETPVDEFHTNSVVRFPCAATTKLLVEAGADVGAMDEDRNTPLHVIVGYRDSVADFMTLHAVISHLLEAGAHVDVVNSRGQTPMQNASSTVAEAILKSQQRISLKCLSAQAVKRHNLSYQGQVPETLETFIELHGP